MPDPSVHYFRFPSDHFGRVIFIASVVLDRGDFVSFCDLMIAEGLPGAELKKELFCPAILRCDKTVVLFSHFNVRDDVDVLSVIVRGMGEKLMEKYFSKGYAPRPSFN